MRLLETIFPVCRRGGLVLLWVGLSISGSVLGNSQDSELASSAPTEVTEHSEVDVGLQALTETELAPAERYRQLSLMLLVSAGVNTEMLADLEKGLPEQSDGTDFNPADYTTPLARIVDQSTLLVGATRLFGATTRNRVKIRARMDQLERDFPEEIAEVNLNALTEDTIIIRQAMGASIAYAEQLPLNQQWAQRYGAHTVVLRNSLEYQQFQYELDVLTSEAIASVGGRLDAYQRMFDDETNSGSFDRRIRSAELKYLPEGQFDPQAGILTQEMLDNMVLMESQPNR